MKAHTPGPWTIEDNRSMCDGEFWILAEHHEVSEVSIAAVRPGCTEAEEIGDNEANARLIAAAPDMYEALRIARRELIVWQRVDDAVDADTNAAIDTINAALAKAEGRA